MSARIASAKVENDLEAMAGFSLPGIPPPRKASATLDDGTEALDFLRWYADEITITERELVGLTLDEAHGLKRRKDADYLRSGS